MSKSYTILAYDPGVSTGWVVGEVKDQDVDIIDYGQFVEPSHIDTARFLMGKVQEHWCRQVVGEQFDLRPGNTFTANLSPVKVNALMDYLVQERDPQSRIFYQTPAVSKTLITDVRLKRLGFWPTGKHVGYKDANDVRDAARHLYRHCVQTLRLTGTCRRMAH